MTVLQQHVPGYIQPLQLQIFLQSLAGFKLQQIIEVSDRQIKLSRHIAGCGQLAALQSSGCDIFHKQTFHVFQKSLVLILTGNKLALVIPGAIIQQKFYMPGKNNTAMSINGMMQLILYIREATRHFLCLTPRKMQRFFLAIMEKGIIFNMILQ